MPQQEIHKDLVVYPFKNYKAWLQWLARNHGQSESIWVKFAKKNSGIASITYEEAREGAIIYGWIDGLINGLDDHYYLTKFSPRRPKSNWSKINCGIAEQLIAEKKMMPSGLAQVQAAQADGRWEAAYSSPGAITVPAALTRLIDSSPTAKHNFAQLSGANRYAFLFKIQNAKRAATKQKHIQRAFEMLQKGEVYHPESQKKPLKKKRAAKKKK